MRNLKNIFVQFSRIVRDGEFLTMIKTLIQVTKSVGSDPTLKIEGPIFGTELIQKNKMDELVEFRDSQYREMCPYLVNEENKTIERELKLDERSAHFIARKEGKIVGCLRLSPPPFEAVALNPTLTHITDKFKNYFELSRLLTIQGRGRIPKVGNRLMLAAGKWAFLRTKKKGFVAVCKPDRARLFERYGFFKDNEVPFSIAIRPGNDYHIVSGDFTTMARTLMGGMFANKTKQARVPQEVWGLQTASE
jgi:hypothetical protein